MALSFYSFYKVPCPFYSFYSKFFGCLLHRFQAGLPIHGSRSHLTKLRAKGITGRLWRSINGLYQNMQSKLLYPNIPDDAYFKIEVGAREGRVLSPILLLTAMDDMREYLIRHLAPPTTVSRGTKTGALRGFGLANRKVGGRRVELSPGHDRPWVWQTDRAHDRCHRRPHSTSRTLVVRLWQWGPVGIGGVGGCKGAGRSEMKRSAMARAGMGIHP
jgi:hypothetical protein